jgi:hypothetical protein
VTAQPRVAARRIHVVPRPGNQAGSPRGLGARRGRPEPPSSRESHAAARASWLQELIYLLYDETKFRLLDGEEQASLGKVSDAIETHRELMANRVLDRRP